MPAPAITVPINVAATAFAEGMHLDFELVIHGNGESEVLVYWRTTKKNDRTMILAFDEYEWRRFVAAIGEADELLKRTDENGATFKIG